MRKGGRYMGINIPDNKSEGTAFENALNSSKSTNVPQRKTNEMEEYRRMVIGVDSSDLYDEKTVSSDK
jgi:hypothetical protein